MSLRTKSDFSLEDVLEGVQFAHQHGVRVYLTLNLFAHNKDVSKLDTFIDTVRTVNPDGLIIADPGVFEYVRQRAPEIPLHVSTQANVCSSLSVRFWKNQGAQLVVLAREVSFAELTEIRRDCPDIRLEAFVHGTMCMTYSGRCLLSNFLSERGANQGNCANSCRWEYRVHLRLNDGTVQELTIDDSNRDMFQFLLEEGTRPGELMPIEEDTRGSYILNSKDLCLLPRLDQYLKMGIDSFKVEGRGKSLYYVAVVARAYRRAMDAWAADPDHWDAGPFLEELDRVPSRGYTLAFHDGQLTNLAHGYEHTGQVSDAVFAGYITRHTDDGFLVDVRNRLDSGDVLEFVLPDEDLCSVFHDVRLRLYEFWLEGRPEPVDVVHPGQTRQLLIRWAQFEHEDQAALPSRMPPLTVIRKEKPLTETEAARVRLDTTARRMELSGSCGCNSGCGTSADQQLYQLQQSTLMAARDQETTPAEPRSLRTGNPGCCGRGCNGCLVFWYDPAYARGRELMQQKKLGEKLDRNSLLDGTR